MHNYIQHLQGKGTNKDALRTVWDRMDRLSSENLVFWKVVALSCRMFRVHLDGKPAGNFGMVVREDANGSSTLSCS